MLWPTRQASASLSNRFDMANTAGQMRRSNRYATATPKAIASLIKLICYGQRRRPEPPLNQFCYSQHRRPVRPSQIVLFWPTPQASDSLKSICYGQHRRPVPRSIQFIIKPQNIRPIKNIWGVKPILNLLRISNRK